MFKKFFFLAMAIICITGCAGKQTATYENLDKIPYAFIAISGEHGHHKVFCPGSAENAANMATLLLEPGFIILVDDVAIRQGEDKKLEQMFQKEGFKLISRREIKNSKLTRLNFAKNGKIVFFID